MNIVKQIAIIIIASVLVVAISLPLANTEWAEGLRTEPGNVEDGGDAGENT